MGGRGDKGLMAAGAKVVFRQAKPGRRQDGEDDIGKKHETGTRLEWRTRGEL